jgi:parallel beta-helix repeat protein
MRGTTILFAFFLTTAASAWELPHTFTVTTTADSGSGSLREAIHSANATCQSGFDRCTIEFRIPNATAPWVTIYPETPLPHVTGWYVTIDGTTQTAFAGNTNARGPEVEVSGVMEREGNGFVSTGCGNFAVHGLVVNGFPGSGVLLASGCHSAGLGFVTGNYIGTDPTGTRSVRNQRGVYVDGNNSGVIEHNVISGNMRSGVYVQRGGGTRIAFNKIGLTPDFGPLGNGASGVYIGPLFSAVVEHNFIGFSHHWGIAIHPHAVMVTAAPNSLQANFSLGIDWGHDLNPTSKETVPPPEITSVRVENGQTIIEGTITPFVTLLEHGVHLYANDAPDESGYGEGQYTLGMTRTFGPNFTFVYPGDLRGKWVTATFARAFVQPLARAPRPDGFPDFVMVATSEFSRAVLVP